MREIPPPISKRSEASFAIETQRKRVPFTTKLIFWLLLGILSVIFAEVTCASSPYPFFEPWGLLVVTPLYTLHTLFLAGLIFKKKSVSFSVLLLAGVLFSLYEALITKVIWDPTWGDKASMIGGIAWLQTSVLIFYWHPWFAFIFPLLFGESLFTNSTEVRATLPVIFTGVGRRTWVILLAVLCGINQGANGAAFDNILLSTLESLGVFLVFASLWKWITKGKDYFIRDLLPRGLELAGVGVLLFVLYGLSSFSIRPESLPAVVLPYLIVGALYFVTILSMVIYLKNAEPVVTVPRFEPRHNFWANVLVFTLVFLASSLLFLRIQPIAGLLIFISWGFGVVMGVILFIRAILIAMIKKRKTYTALIVSRYN